MRPPASAVVDNVVWGGDGGVWAVFEVTARPYGHCSASERLDVHAGLRALLAGLAGESLLLSTAETIDPAEVAEAMAAGVDVAVHADWAAACDITVAGLGDDGAARRRFWLAVSLADLSTGRGLRRLLGVGASGVATRFGVAAAPPTGAEIDARRRQAAAVGGRLGPACMATTPGRIRWLYARQMRRGCGSEPFYDDTWEPPGDSISGGGLGVLVDAAVFEGGAAADAHRPGHRRYVRIDTDHGTSYQTVVVLAAMPHSFVFPGGGGEWFHHLNVLGFAVDWAVRLRAVANADAQAKTRRQANQLAGQIGEYDGEVTGAPAGLSAAIAAVDQERALLAANPTETELQATICFGLAADNLADLEDQAAALAALFEPHEYATARPTGGQGPLIRAFLAGTDTPPVARDYTQFLLAGDLAAGVPFTSTEVGDPTGMLLGYSADTATGPPVLFDPAYGPSVNRSASLGACGTLGTGKSYLAKRLAWATIARGGQVVTMDRTATGEYVAFAAAAPGTTQVISLDGDTNICLDPLRVFAGDDRVRHTIGFLSLLAGVGAQSLAGAALADATEAVAARPDAALADIIAELETQATSPGRPSPPAGDVAAILRHYARLGPAAVTFGDGEPVGLDADLIVFHAPGLALPDRDTLTNPHLAAQMLPEQVYARALLFLVAAVGRSVIFADPARFGALLIDEAWAMTSSPHGQALLLEAIRDGRKHNAAVWMFSQHPNDFGTGELADLLGPRFVFRHSTGAAPAAANFVGLDATAESLIASQLASGECLYRDVAGRIGHITIAPDPTAAVHAAANTTPTAPTTPAPATPAAASLDDIQGPRAEPGAAPTTDPPAAPTVGPSTRSRRRVFEPSAPQ